MYLSFTHVCIYFSFVLDFFLLCLGGLFVNDLHLNELCFNSQCPSMFGRSEFHTRDPFYSSKLATQRAQLELNQINLLNYTIPQPSQSDETASPVHTVQKSKIFAVFSYFLDPIANPTTDCWTYPQVL